MNPEMGRLLKSLFAEEQKADREQSRARGPENKDKNEDVTEILLLRASVEFIRRGGDDREPGQDEGYDGKRVPGDDAPG
jgi:hypothetical protein